MQILQRLSQRIEAKIGLTFRTIHTIEERCEVDHFRSRIHEIEIEYLLPRHGFKMLTGHVGCNPLETMQPRNEFRGRINSASRAKIFAVYSSSAPKSL